MSPLPSWAGKRRGPKVYYDMADSAHSAPGWRILGDDFYTCLKPLDAPYLDAEVIRSIQAFDPSIIVLWRKQRYLPPNGTEPQTFTHLALGRHVKVPLREMALFHVEMPEDASHEAPNELILVWEFFGDRYFKGGGPGDHMPCDMRLYWFLRHQFNNTKTAKQVAIEHEARVRKLHEQRRKTIREDLAYRQKHLDEYVRRQLDQPGDSMSAWHQYAARLKAEKGATKPRAFFGKGAGQ